MNGSTGPIEIILAQPRGFCAGVERAIETVRLTLRRYGEPVYVLHEIVHNLHVLNELEQLGAVFVEDLADIPAGGICIFSAHGVSRAVEQAARQLGLKTVDATCPLVGSVHRMVEKYHGEGCDVLIIGHHGHPEVIGAAGRVTDRVHVISSEQEARQCRVTDPGKVAYVTQTTLSREDIIGIVKIFKQRFPDIRGPSSNICFATQNRQDAVKRLAEQTDLILVVGSKNSSNSNRLREVAQRHGTPGYLIDDSGDLQASWFDGKQKVGITAGASAPERLVRGVIDWIRERREATITEMGGKKEHVHFDPAVVVERQ
ncbi:MAG: 4-hydroxy-3-methylbut-2-enyl diphosphate reductase [Desulfoprunum sp.]|jgi:4-hydroxy-3-methylbut-2-enyl diphosphate reductase